MNDKCCLGCKDRTVEPNCHETCPKYKEFCSENKKRKEIVKIAKQQTQLSIHKSNRYY